MTRRLAAVLAADVVGFSRLMGADEAGTHARLRALTESFIEPLVADHSGRIVKLLGDGYLVEFGSAVDAVECAVAWQRGPDAATGGPAQFAFRIGINVGDVIVDGDDLYGDGVNVAARLEALAVTGAILVSSDTYRQVRGKTPAAFDDLGEVELKNIEDPVHVYQITGSVPASQPDVDGGLTIPAKPSIAILPFANSSEDADQEYFSDGISEDIITALSRVRWFFVIARNSSFSYKGRRVDLKTVARELGVRYVLEGSVRRAGDRIRVSARLADGSTGNQLWAKRYDRVLSDLFAVQDEITETIVAAIEPELGRIERDRARARTPENLDAWEAYQQGMWHLYQYTPDGMREARTMFHRAIERDPDLAPAFSGIAESYYFDAVYGFADSMEACRTASLDPARRAVEIDRGDAAAWCTLGRIHYLRREHAEAVLELETALELNPSLALAHYGLGAALAFSGRATEAVPHLEDAIRLSPYDPNLGSFLVRLADANYFLGRYEDAADWARRALGQPGFQWSRYSALLAALGRLGRADEASGIRGEIMARRPTFSIDFVRERHLIADGTDLGGYLDGLRAAGVPET